MTVQSRRRPMIGMPASGSIVSPIGNSGGGSKSKKFACATCRISFETPEGQRAKCPLCESQKDRMQLLEALRELKDRLERTTNELARLRPLVDLVAAMHTALKVTGVDDLTFLKSVAYRYRQDGSVTLEVLNGVRGATMSAPVGFLAKSKVGEAEIYQCTSVGGLTLAHYVAEAMRSVGPQTAMQHLVRAMSDHLTGGMR